MEIKVSEYSIGKVAVGQEAEISADILDGETVRGQVVSISPTGEEKGGGSTERVIPTKVRIMDENTKLIAGITAQGPDRPGGKGGCPNGAGGRRDGTEPEFPWCWQ